MKPKCIITGCDMIAADTDQIVHGDLWELGDSYIFNAVLYDGEAYWQDHHPTGSVPKAILINKITDRYFERRGVFVIHKDVAELTTIAQEYINDAP